MDIKKLQRAIVDGLEDVKAHDIKVFNTSHLTALFDRVVIASGTSNRHTRSLASSVAERVRDNGGHVVSVEGAETGEWVLVDCGDAVVHILQPAIRQYYNLEEVWGDKPVHVKLAEPSSSSVGELPESAETHASHVNRHTNRPLHRDAPIQEDKSSEAYVRRVRATRGAP